MAYLEPQRVEMPPAVRRVLRDAHARLGGTACGAKQVALMLLSAHGMQAARGHALNCNQAGQVVHGGEAVSGTQVAQIGSFAMRQARMAGEPLYAACRDAEAVQQAGLGPGGEANVHLEARIWRLEGLAWRQRQQRREEEGGGVQWERRGGAGRRGRRWREPGVAWCLRWAPPAGARRGGRCRTRRRRACWCGR